MERGESHGCLSMHQPWASLLVHGIKRIEGRSWPSPLTGELWIHAASKVPDPATIKIMENYYREIYAVNGITDLKFPEHYPVSQLLGCIKVVGCVKSEELACWENVPESVRLEALTDFCWLCEEPKKLVNPLDMRGYKGVYDLDKKMYKVAIGGLCSVGGPQLVHFPLPDPQNLFSLKPGSLLPYLPCSKSSKPEKSPSLTAAITAARAAATQFSKREVSHKTNTFQERRHFGSSSRRNSENRYIGEVKATNVNFQQRPRERGSYHKYEQNSNTHDDSSRHFENQLNEDSRKSTVTLQWQPGKIVSSSSYNGKNSFSIHSSSRGWSDSKFDEDNGNSAGSSQLLQERHLAPNYREKQTQTFHPSSCAFRSSVRDWPDGVFSEDNRNSTRSSQLQQERHSAPNFREKHTHTIHLSRQPENKFTKSGKSLQWRPQIRDSGHGYKGQNTRMECEANSSSYDEAPRRDVSLQFGNSSKIFTDALKGLKLT